MKDKTETKCGELGAVLLVVLAALFVGLVLVYPFLPAVTQERLGKDAIAVDLDTESPQASSEGVPTCGDSLYPGSSCGSEETPAPTALDEFCAAEVQSDLEIAVTEWMSNLTISENATKGQILQSDTNRFIDLAEDQENRKALSETVSEKLRIKTEGLQDFVDLIADTVAEKVADAELATIAAAFSDPIPVADTKLPNGSNLPDNSARAQEKIAVVQTLAHSVIFEVAATLGCGGGDVGGGGGGPKPTATATPTHTPLCRPKKPEPRGCADAHKTVAAAASALKASRAELAKKIRELQNKFNLTANRLKHECARATRARAKIKLLVKLFNNKKNPSCATCCEADSKWGTAECMACQGIIDDVKTLSKSVVDLIRNIINDPILETAYNECTKAQEKAQTDSRVCADAAKDAQSKNCYEPGCKNPGTAVVELCGGGAEDCNEGLMEPLRKACPSDVPSLPSCRLGGTSGESSSGSGDTPPAGDLDKNKCSNEPGYTHPDCCCTCTFTEKTARGEFPRSADLRGNRTQGNCTDACSVHIAAYLNTQPGSTASNIKTSRGACPGK